MKLTCDYFKSKSCQSCSMIELDYEEQIFQKEEEIKLLFSEFNFKLETTQKSSIKDFRNKVKYVVSGTTSHPCIGLIHQSDLNQGIELTDCPIQYRGLNDLMKSLKIVISDYKLEPYLVKERVGELKGIIAYQSQSSGKIILRFILRSKKLYPNILKASEVLVKKNPMLHSICANIQPIAHAILEGSEEDLIWGQEYLEEVLANQYCYLYPGSFFQTNTEVAVALYQRVAQVIKDLRANFLLDLYCGVGCFSFFSAPYVKKAVGIELNPKAIKSAQLGKMKNHYSHLDFYSSSVEQYLEDQMNEKPDVIILNPPRRGIASAIKKLILLEAKYLIYSSCNPKTLFEDVKFLSSKYELESLKVFDMFAHSKHMEVLAILRLKEMV